MGEADGSGEAGIVPEYSKLYAFPPGSGDVPSGSEPRQQDCGQLEEAKEQERLTQEGEESDIVCSL